MSKPTPQTPTTAESLGALLKSARDIAAQNVLRNKIRRAPRRFTERHAETDKIFGVHAFNKLKLHRSER